MSNLAQAIQFAHLCHAGQRRKYIDEPYINHPVRVMQSVACDDNFGGNQEMSMAAVLHDVIEDTDVGDLGADWGENVVKWVNELTNEFTKENYPSMNRRQRKAAEIGRIAGISLEAKVIKLYDRIDNLRSWFYPGLRWTDDMEGFGRLYADESWNLILALKDPRLNYLTAQAFSLTKALKEFT
jgi:(p)ppGpp synthase/HD superfamily hydrolase